MIGNLTKIQKRKLKDLRQNMKSLQKNITTIFWLLSNMSKPVRLTENT